MARVSASSLLCRLGRASANRISFVRWVGTQTPQWRERQVALDKVAAARRTLQRQNWPDEGMRCNLREPGELLMPDISEAVALSSPTELVASAFEAAEQGDELKCASLVWSLKELPRDSEVMRAVDAVHGTSRRTLLQEVSAQGLERPVSLLLDMAADVKLKDEDGRTALHMAALRNHGPVAQLLLSYGRANVHARDRESRTPLHLATDKGNRRVARVLVRFGADPSSVDGQGRSPLEEKKGAKGGDIPHRAQLVNWMKNYVQHREKTSKNLGKIRYFDGLGTKLPSHIVAPKLVLTSIGYCPSEDGKTVELKRGIRVNKRRRGPSAPSGKVNWYSPRG
eukprot:TRINITY_DN95172_c0_g1_i1.p1 TRINITY_DN95172_c0_g1~~TRINITY_DN95172_c0_g1_i1.p1  ORF type:complete len:354 (-),score=65.42 TRINITY_DN95172_c0_g1_i1:139-1155(-)